MWPLIKILRPLVTAVFCLASASKSRHTGSNTPSFRSQVIDKENIIKQMPLTSPLSASLTLASSSSPEVTRSISAASILDGFLPYCHSNTVTFPRSAINRSRGRQSWCTSDLQFTHYISSAGGSGIMVTLLRFLCPILHKTGSFQVHSAEPIM